MTAKFAGMTLEPILFEVALFLLSSLVTGSSFMSASLLFLELQEFSFISN